MLTLLIILFLIAAGEYILYNSKLFKLNKKLLLVVRENDVLKKELLHSNSIEAKLHISYSPSPYKQGCTKSNSHIYLVPFKNSPLLHQCLGRTRLSISSCVTIDLDIWYYIQLRCSDTLINGWIQQEDIKFIIDDDHLDNKSIQALQ